MTQEYIGGGSAIALYAYEDPDNWTLAPTAHTASSLTFGPFGRGIEVNITRSNNAEKIYGVGARNAVQTANLQYSGKLTVKGLVSNMYWLLGAVGANSNGGTTGAYTHTYTEANRLPSFTTKLGVELGTTDSQSVILGCRIASATMTCAINEPLKFSLDIPYRYETLGTTVSSNSFDTEPVFTFAHGAIQLPSGTTIAAIQTFELTINNNITTEHGVGTRFVDDLVAGKREYNFNLTAAFNDQTQLFTRFLNGTASATAPTTGNGTVIASLILTFTNDDGDTAVWTFANVSINEHSLPMSVKEVVKENITGWARSLTSVIYTNDIQTAPAEDTNV